MTRPSDCLVTMEQLRALEPMKRYDVKVRDADGVSPKSRGKTFGIIFRGIAISQEHLPNTSVQDPPNDPRFWMVQGYSADDTQLIYGFHGWLIETIEETP